MGILYNRVFRWASGKTPLPDGYYFDENCSKNHAINGRVVRRHRNKDRAGPCLLCRQALTRKHDYKRDDYDGNGLIHKSALSLYEDMQTDLDDDPLFD
jgi:hypothetical protein